MNQTPKPVDLNKLKGILGNARAIMNKVEGDTKTPNTNKYVENTDNYITEAEMQQQQQPINQPTQNRQITKEAIINSKLPDAVKKAMLENPIQQTNGLTHTFNLDDVSDLVENKPTKRKKRVNETSSNKNTINEKYLRELIKDVLIEYLTTDYSKNLTEGVIKKTISTLLKEGKIKTKR